MTREEEIRKSAFEYIKSDAVKAGDEYTSFGDFINGAKWADANPHWVSVEDELPKEKGWIILSTFFNSVACPAYYYEGEDVEELRSQGITHWMPLPALSCSDFPNNQERRVIGTADHIKAALDVLYKEGGEE